MMWEGGCGEAGLGRGCGWSRLGVWCRMPDPTAGEYTVNYLVCAVQRRRVPCAGGQLPGCRVLP